MVPVSLAERLARVPDPRDDSGKRHPLAAVLNLLAVGVLCGLRGLGAIAQLGRHLSRADARALGFTHPITPCKATLSNLLRRLDLAQVEAELRVWAADRAGRPTHLAVDGKTVRGSHDQDVPAVHLLAVYAAEAGVTVAQVPVGTKTNEHKAALELLREVPPAGAVVTADALFTHRDFCQVVRDGGGDYLLPVEENQPTLRRDIQAAFAPEPGLSPPTAAVAGGAGAVRP
jgi:DDE_Tnp_1-associated/Transposase DDE domain